MLPNVQERDGRGSLIGEISEFCVTTFPHSTELSTSVHMLREAVELLTSCAKREGAYLTEDDTFQLNRYVENMMMVVEMALKRREASDLTSFQFRPSLDDVAAECADIFHLIVQMSINTGFDLEQSTREKLEINKTRKWKEPDKYGVVEHDSGSDDD